MEANHKKLRLKWMKIIKGYAPNECRSKEGIAPISLSSLDFNLKRGGTVPIQKYFLA